MATSGIPLEINASTIKYSGNFKNYPVNVTYTFKENKNYNSISSQIKSKKFNEKNETILKNNQLYKMTQKTENGLITNILIGTYH